VISPLTCPYLTEWLDDRAAGGSAASSAMDALEQYGAKGEGGLHRGRSGSNLGMDTSW
jgi:hypothetical protein